MMRRALRQPGHRPPTGPGLAPQSRARKEAVLPVPPLRHGSGSDRTGGFTLVELLVVISIIALVAAIATPALKPMFASNQRAAAQTSLNALLIQAQATAHAVGDRVGVRIGRAYKTDPQLGILADVQGHTRYHETFASSHPRFDGPVPLDYQDGRIVRLAQDPYGSVGAGMLEWSAGSKVESFPRNIWLAPGYAPELSLSEADLVTNNPPGLSKPDDGLDVPLNRMDTFYIMFSPSGELTRLTDPYYYRDKLQVWWDSNSKEMPTPAISHPDPSARSVLLYDREKFRSLGAASPAAQDTVRRDFLMREGQPIYINRATGAIAEDVK